VSLYNIGGFCEGKERPFTNDLGCAKLLNAIAIPNYETNFKPDPELYCDDLIPFACCIPYVPRFIEQTLSLATNMFRI
jgi:hypothetical protein